MAKTFTWFEFLMLSESSLDFPAEPKGDTGAKAVNDEIFGPSKAILDHIYSYAETYCVLQSRTLGSVELILN